MAANEHAGGDDLDHSNRLGCAIDHVTDWPVCCVDRVLVAGFREPVLHGRHGDRHGRLCAGVHFDLEILAGKWWAWIEATVKYS